MKSAGKMLWVIGGLIVALLVVAVLIGWICWFSKPGTYEQRFDRIETGMTETMVQDIMGSEGDLTKKKYQITGDNRQRVWVITEKGYRLVLVVVFDTDSRVLTKGMYKTRLLDEIIFKDM
jgi:hypothetical protein